MTNPQMGHFFRRLQIDGGKYHNDGATENALLSADMSLTVDEASEMQFVMNDPGWAYLKSFGEKGPLGKFGTYNSVMKLACTGYSLDGGPTGNGGTTIKFQPQGIVRSRKIKGPLTREGITPSQFVKDAATSAGMTSVVQDSPGRPSISRDVPDEQSPDEEANEWTTLNRLAAEEGFLLFECNNVLYFGSPQWLFDTRPAHIVAMRDADRPNRIVTLPTIDVTSAEMDDEISFDLRLESVGKILPGHGITIKDVPGVGGKKLLVTSVSYPLAGNGLMQITAKRPWKIEKQDTPEQAAAKQAQSNSSGGGGGGGGAVTGGKGVKFRYTPGKDEGVQMVDAALEYLGITYSWGGGNFQGPTKGIRDGGVADQHGDYNKVGFDCSGLTLYAAYQGTNGRVKLGHYTGTQIGQGRQISAGEVKAGDLVFPNSGHVAICMGNGKMVEAPQSGDVVKISNLRGGTYVRVH